MEKIKIKMNEIEGMTLKIPTEFTGYSFNKFYNQLLLVAKSMPDIKLHSSAYSKKEISATPERLSMYKWQDEEENKTMLEIWERDGKQAVVKWIKETRNIELTEIEKRRLCSLISNIRIKHRKQNQ